MTNDQKTLDHLVQSVEQLRVKLHELSKSAYEIEQLCTKLWISLGQQRDPKHPAYYSNTTTD